MHKTQCVPRVLEQTEYQFHPFKNKTGHQFQVLFFFSVKKYFIAKNANIITIVTSMITKIIDHYKHNSNNYNV